jgi:hypothetical protein
VFKLKEFALSILIIIGLSFPLPAGQIIIGGWALTTDNSGGVTSMTLSNPKTDLNIESVIEIFVDYQGTPVRGNVVFVNGLKRDLNYPAETMTYWDNYGGSQALWKYFASVNRIELFNPDESKIPPQMYGRMTHVIGKSGEEYIGKLVEFTNNPDWFILQIKDGPVTFYRHAVGIMQQLK